MGFAWLIAMDPGYMADLSRLREWLETWRAGGNPYAEYFDVDYPPNALVLLAPLSWFSDAALPIVYPPLLMVATAAGAWILSGWMAEQFGVTLTPRDRVLLVLLMLAGESTRSAIWRGQTSPFALLFGAAALRLKARRPAWAAVMLACCAFKPHVAVGFGLAILVTHGVVIPAAGALLTLVQSALFAAHAHVGVQDVWGGYVTTLWRLYSGPERVRGLLSIRWVLEDLSGNFTFGTLLYVAMALASGTCLAYAAGQAQTRAHRGQIVAALFLWSLLFLPHQLYHGWMAAPALWLMMWPESGLIRRALVRTSLVVPYVAFGVIDVPRLVRLFVHPGTSGTAGWWSYALSPLRIAVIFALLLVMIVRRQRHPGPQTSPATSGPLAIE